MMQAQLMCVLFLCFTCGGLCAGVDQEQRALEEDLISSLFTSKLKQNKQSAPYWRVSLANLCNLVNSLRQGAWSSEDEEEEELREGSIRLLEELYSLRHICRALQGREEQQPLDSVEYSEEIADTPPKRKSPYILKRQTVHSTKSRRPYILKRSRGY
ncbi:neurotensin/neuromedin N [Thalassophryne amazonica]|uniref:neurotensin/neuromedin N n=1 Tax=Thalassophryne amazonica TaxID=390379 RepID=UPI0014709E6F|nr:neurotensin/neuromedin N [Thalassophryne amazonica]